MNFPPAGAVDTVRARFLLFIYTGVRSHRGIVDLCPQHSYPWPRAAPERTG